MLDQLTKTTTIDWWIDLFYYSRAVGIDIQSDRITIIAIEKTITGIRLIDTLSLDLSLSPFGEVQKEEEAKFLTSLKQFFQTNNLKKDTELVIGLPGNQVMQKPVTIPSPDESSIKNIISYDIERHLPVSKDDIYYDFDVSEKKEGNLYTVMLFASKKLTFDYYFLLLKKISLTPTIVYSSSLSGVNLYRFSQEKGHSPTILIMLDKNGITFSCIKKRMLYGSKYYPLSHGMTGWIAPFFNGSSGDSLQKGGDFIAAEVNQIRSSVPLFSDETNRPTVVFTGKSDQINRLCRYLEGNKEIAAYSFDPAIKIKNISPSEKKSITPYLTALGLGLRGVSSLFVNINLIPGGSKKRITKKNIIITSALLIVFFIVFLVSITGGYIKDTLALKKVAQDLSLVKRKAETIEGKGIQSELLEKQSTSFAVIQKAAISKLKVLRELTGIIPTSVWVTNFRIYDDYMEITGYANTASDLIKILEDSELFTDVKFLGTIKKENGKEKFKISTHLE